MVEYALLTLGDATTPTWITNLDFSTVTSNAEAIAGAVVPVIVTVLGLTIAVRLLKSFANKIG